MSGWYKQQQYPKKFRNGYSRTGGLYKMAGYTKEIKFYDQNFNTQALPIVTEAEITSFNTGIVQAAGASERIGRSITVKRIQAILNITRISAGGNEGRCCAAVRIDIWLDTQANGTTPTKSDIYDTSPNDEIAIAFPNIENNERFKLITTKRYQFNANAGLSVGSQWPDEQKICQIDIPCNIPITYSGSDGTETEIRSNNILFVISQLANVNGLIFTRKVMRIRYSDS